jgi:hypothetical protein
MPVDGRRLDGHRRVYTPVLSSSYPFHTLPFHHVISFKYTLPNVVSLPMQTLFGRPVPLIPSLFSRLRTEVFQRIFRRVWPRFQPKFCPRRDGRSRQEGQEYRKEMTRTRTLSGVKGRAPGAVPNEEEILTPDKGFPPLKLGPRGGESASQLDSEWGLYLHLSSLIIFLPHHRRYPSFSKRWARSRVVLKIVNAVPHAPPSHVAGVPSSGLVFLPQTPNLDTLTNNGHHRLPPAGAIIRFPFLSTPRRPRPRLGRPPSPHRYRGARHT